MSHEKATKIAEIARSQIQEKFDALCKTTEGVTKENFDYFAFQALLQADPKAFKDFWEAVEEDGRSRSLFEINCLWAEALQIKKPEWATI